MLRIPTIIYLCSVLSLLSEHNDVCIDLQSSDYCPTMYHPDILNLNNL